MIADRCDFRVSRHGAYSGRVVNLDCIRLGLCVPRGDELYPRLQSIRLERWTSELCAIVSLVAFRTTPRWTHELSAQ